MVEAEMQNGQCDVHPLPPSESSPVETALQSLHSLLQNVDRGSSVDAVVKTPSGATMVRVTPTTGEGTRFLALQTAIRIAFPFDTTTVVENVSTGGVQLQVLMHTFNDQMRQARTQIKSYRSMKLIHFASKLFMVLAVSSFALLLQNHVISQANALEM